MNSTNQAPGATDSMPQTTTSTRHTPSHKQATPGIAKPQHHSNRQSATNQPASQLTKYSSDEELGAKQQEPKDRKPKPTAKTNIGLARVCSQAAMTMQAQNKLSETHKREQTAAHQAPRATHQVTHKPNTTSVTRQSRIRSSNPRAQSQLQTLCG